MYQFPISLSVFLTHYIDPSYCITPCHQMDDQTLPTNTLLELSPMTVPPVLLSSDVTPILKKPTTYLKPSDISHAMYQEGYPLTLCSSKALPRHPHLSYQTPDWKVQVLEWRAELDAKAQISAGAMLFVLLHHLSASPSNTTHHNADSDDDNTVGHCDQCNGPLAYCHCTGICPS
jgi:hypothetical protein